MQRFIITICIIGASLGNAIAQEVRVSPEEHQNGVERIHAFLCPHDVVLPVIANQPDSPIEFLKAETYWVIEGGGFDDYSIRNRSTKPIRSFQLAIIYSTGGGSGTIWHARSDADLMMPGQSDPRARNRSDEPSRIEIVPLTKSLREEKKLQVMKALAIFMVVRVEFSDGTTFTDEGAYQALTVFFEENGIAPPEK
jgi:hypothetical protein